MWIFYLLWIIYEFIMTPNLWNLIKSFFFQYRSIFFKFMQILGKFELFRQIFTSPPPIYDLSKIFQPVKVGFQRDTIPLVLDPVF